MAYSSSNQLLHYQDFYLNLYCYGKLKDLILYMFCRQTRTKPFKAMWEKISASNLSNELNNAYQELNSCRMSQDRKD